MSRKLGNLLKMAMLINGPSIMLWYALQISSYMATDASSCKQNLEVQGAEQLVIACLF